MKPIVRKDEKTGTYELVLSIGAVYLGYKGIKTKTFAESLQNSIIKEIEGIKINKLRETLSDREIGAWATTRYPYTDKGSFVDNAIQDAIRKEFIKTAKLVRDKFLEINLKATDNE